MNMGDNILGIDGVNAVRCEIDERDAIYVTDLGEGESYTRQGHVDCMTGKISFNAEVVDFDMEAIEERLAVIEKLCSESNEELRVVNASLDVLEKGEDLILDKIAEKDKENKEDHTSMMNFWHELRLKKELGGGDSGANVIDIAKAFAVISKPELIKELSK